MSSKAFGTVSAVSRLIKVSIYLRRPIAFDYSDTTVNPALLKLVYTMNLPSQSEDSDRAILQRVFYLFNYEHPLDYKDRSLSVGDVVTLGERRSYLCRPVGWLHLPTPIH